jgi:hypothetical protein
VRLTADVSAHSAAARTASRRTSPAPM